MPIVPQRTDRYPFCVAFSPDRVGTSSKSLKRMRPRAARYLFALCLVLMAGFAQAQGDGPAARKVMQFEVASVKENKSDEKAHSNFPLNSGPQYGPNGGVLSAHNMVLLQYIVFAYKPSSYQIKTLRTGLPEWARSAHFDVEARAESTAGREPSKDEMRLMMQALLADRFKLKVHHESREVPVFALVLAKPGKLGPKLRPHPADDPNCSKAPLPDSVAGGYPAACGAGASMPASQPGLTAIGGRNVAMADFVQGLTNLANGVERPVIDQTGLEGKYDFALEWSPDLGNGVPPGLDGAPDPEGSSFFGALREQLGLKLVAQKDMVDALVIDSVERPSGN